MTKLNERENEDARIAGGKALIERWGSDGPLKNGFQRRLNRVRSLYQTLPDKTRGRLEAANRRGVSHLNEVDTIVCLEFFASQFCFRLGQDAPIEELKRIPDGLLAEIVRGLVESNCPQMP